MNVLLLPEPVSVFVSVILPVVVSLSIDKPVLTARVTVSVVELVPTNCIFSSFALAPFAVTKSYVVFKSTVLIVNPVADTPEKDTFVPAVIRIGSSSALPDASNNNSTLEPLEEVIKS